MIATAQNSASVLSIGVFFSIITLGLAATLPSHMYAGLVANGVHHNDALKIAHLPPIGTLFAAFLGYNPVQQLLGGAHGALSYLPHAQAAYLTGRSFFPKLISAPFATGLHLAFWFAGGLSVIGAIASWLRGGRYIHDSALLIDGVPVAEAGTRVAVTGSSSMEESTL